MEVRTDMLVFFVQDFEGLTQVFATGRPPGNPRGRPPDIQPQNLLFGLPFLFLSFLPFALFFVPLPLVPGSAARNNLQDC